MWAMFALRFTSVVLRYRRPPLWRRYKSVVLKRPLSRAGIAALLRYARKGPRGSRVFEFDSLRGAVAAVPSGATAAANLRQANTVLVLRANSQDKGEATRALQDVSAGRQRLRQYKASAACRAAAALPALGRWRA